MAVLSVRLRGVKSFSHDILGGGDPPASHSSVTDEPLMIQAGRGNTLKNGKSILSGTIG